MTFEERSDLVLAAAKALYVNGQSTEHTLAAAGRLGESLGLRVTALARWGELSLQADNGAERLVRAIAADPTGVDMDRVACAMHLIDRAAAGELSPDAARTEVGAISKKPPAPTWLFAIAAAAGAAALSVIFGVHHLAAVALIAASAGAGAVLRRGLARLSANVFLQPFCAALLAGAVGALAVRYQLSSSLRLVAVCPCMILVPGPHLLNGGLDLIRGRISLGAARIVFAGLVVVAISTGLLFGLALFGADLPVDPAGRAVPLWQDTIAAGVAVAAYSIFFSTPLRMLGWPVAIGMLAHALRWAAMTGAGFGAAAGALAACLTVGLVLTPIANRLQMPFAAVGFASVVSMMPGVFLFRMASGLVQIAGGPSADPSVIGETLSNAATAATIVLAMSLGLLTPKLLIDGLGERARRRAP
ncbi:MAG TPA: threonine/serine exporter family protein [Phenylobacterium sp.]|uniref:threonine/serine ThrE exporter family protein n=2 Tax=Phenylobacterium sp. TaxID=1871053 RepID=UPI002D1AB942|nr:threonine/serine exporter family protein [Phenylobacterium sp.]HXA37904.1 threonine/serine exporter family protein [Phenylobacterium sp.]